MKIYCEIISIPMMIQASLKDFQMLNQTSIPEELSSEEESGEESDSEPENDTEWIDKLRVVHVEQFNKDWAHVSCRF